MLRVEECNDDSSRVLFDCPLIGRFMHRMYMPGVVTSAFAASFVAAMGTANLGGRFISAVTSDKLANMTVGTFFNFACFYVCASPRILWLKKILCLRAHVFHARAYVVGCVRRRCRCCVPRAQIPSMVSICRRQFALFEAICMLGVTFEAI